MRRHVGAETLARFGQGDLGRRKSSRINAHLAGCARCRELRAELTAVSTLLAAANPPPIPEHLAVRISGALAAAAARRSAMPAGATSPAPAVRAAAGAAGPGRTDGGRLPRLASSVTVRAVAAAAVLLLIAGGVYQLTRPGGSSPPPASTRLSGPAVRRAATSGPRAVTGVPAAGPALPYRHAGHSSSVTPIATDTNFTPENLGSQVAAELARYGTGSVKAGLNPIAPSAAGGTAAAPDVRPALGNMPLSALRGCVNRIAAGNQVLLVDVARYRGAPATVIVTKGPTGSPDEAWVVGPGCSASRGDVLARTALPATG